MKLNFVKCLKTFCVFDAISPQTNIIIKTDIPLLKPEEACNSSRSQETDPETTFMFREPHQFQMCFFMCELMYPVFYFKNI